MKQFVFILILLVLAACGKHESTSYGFTNNSNVKQGDKAETPEDFMLIAISEDKKGLFLETLEKMDVNSLLKNGRTALIQSTINNRPFFVFTLLQKGADRELADSTQKKALDYAKENSFVRIELMLNEEKSLQIQAALMTAVVSGATKDVNIYFEQGANPNFLTESGETPLTLAIKTFISTKKSSLLLTAIAVAKWVDKEFATTTTDVMLANAAMETPLLLAESLDVTKPADKKNKAELIKILNSKSTQEQEKP